MCSLPMNLPEVEHLLHRHKTTQNTYGGGRGSSAYFRRVAASQQSATTTTPTTHLQRRVERKLHPARARRHQQLLDGNRPLARVERARALRPEPRIHPTEQRPPVLIQVRLLILILYLCHCGGRRTRGLLLVLLVAVATACRARAAAQCCC